MRFSLVLEVGLAPLRGHTGGSAVITPALQNSPPDYFA